ncbi:MAG TPA: YceI family protein [Acidimicrobiales bacterium]|jgi:polyisoprenoid-binding protein YceI|nr:YceI family protein [Acidimicrobiales bacterium]
MADNEVTTRTVDGVELPLAGTYVLDVAHTQVGFAVRHMAVSKVRGRFTKFDGTIQIAEDPTASSVSVTIDANSIDTQDETRNNHLRTNDFFDVENHPTWTFVSTSMIPDGKAKWKLTGDLTIRGVTRPVTLETSLEGVVKDPYGNLRVGFSASAEIDREDFDVSFGAVMDAGGLVVAKKVTIEIEAEAVLQA